MPLTKLRRPKYERRNIKQNLFTIQTSNQRLNKIQRILKEKEIDGLLVIIGVDGRFNSGSLDVFNYLLFDVYSTRQDDIARTKLDDFVFDDVMLCVQQDEIHVCCNGVNYWLLLPYISHWPGLRLHAIPESEMEDSDKAEMFKMQTFVEMTRRCSRIGVSIKTWDNEIDEDTFNPMILEDWPIVQSYAYDNFGAFSYENAKKGFFTLVHKIEDLSKELYSIFREIDTVSLENMYVKILPQMQGLFENIYQLIDTKCSSKDFQINEDRLEEPVLSYYSHYKGLSASLKERINTRPFVLTGPNTRKHILQNKISNVLELNESSREIIVKNPTHFIIQCISLQTGIVIGRTAFINYSPFSKSQQDISHTFIGDDIKELSLAYHIIIKTVEYVIDDIKKNTILDLNSINGEEYLRTRLEEMQYSNIVFRIQRVDDASEMHCFMFLIQAVIFDVVCRTTNKNLGSVMFADTFVVNSALLRAGEAINSVLRLGKDVPLFCYWSDQRLSDLHNHISEHYHLDSFGTENLDIFLPDDIFHEDFAHNACCTFYKDRIMLYNKRIGASIIFPKSVEIFEGEKYGDWTIFTLFFEKDEFSSNWIWNSNNRGTIYLVFTNRSSSRKFITNVVIPQWKETIHITNIDKLQYPFLINSWSNIIQWMNSDSLSDTDIQKQSIIEGISEDTNKCSLTKILHNMNSNVTNKRSCIRIFCTFMELSYALQHMNNLDFLEEIRNRDYNTFETLKQCWRIFPLMDHSKLEFVKDTPNENEAVIVTVLCGLSGSGHDQVARKITKLIKEDIFWILVEVTNLERLIPAMERSVKRFCKLNAAAEGRHMRMILVAPPMCSPLLICQMVLSLNTKIPFVIGSCCFCVDPHSAYLDENEFTLPGLLDMCSVGWVTCILLTGTDDNSIQTNNLHRLLESKNDLCTIFRTPKAEVNKELDTILSPVAFQQIRFALSRILVNTPPCENGELFKNIKRISNELFEVTFPLFGNLSKENIIFTCKDIFKNIQSCPFERNIYFLDGIFGIEEDAGKIYSFSATALTKRISFLPCKNNVSGDGPLDEQSNYFIRAFIQSPTLENLLINKDFVLIDAWKSQLLTILQNFQTHIPKKKNKISSSDLTAEQVENIHVLKHLDILPEGWFYNGLTYINMEGTRSEKHPNLQNFIEDFVRQENIAIEKYNTSLEKMSFSDSFQKI